MTPALAYLGTGMPRLHGGQPGDYLLDGYALLFQHGQQRLGSVLAVVFSRQLSLNSLAKATHLDCLRHAVNVH